jgi:hypothetical protein
LLEAGKTFFPTMRSVEQTRLVFHYSVELAGLWMAKAASNYQS